MRVVINLLHMKQLKIECPFGEPDKRDGDHCQRTTCDDQSAVGPGIAGSGRVHSIVDADRLSQEQDQGLESLLVMSATAVPQS